MQRGKEEEKKIMHNGSERERARALEKHKKRVQCLLFYGTQRPLKASVGCPQEDFECITACLISHQTMHTKIYNIGEG